VCGHPLLDSSRCLETTDSGFQAHLKSTERLYNPIDRLLSGCTHNRFDRYSLELVYKTSIFNACLSASRRRGKIEKGLKNREILVARKNRKRHALKTGNGEP
jgi:hypothetical protein